MGHIPVYLHKDIEGKMLLPAIQGPMFFYKYRTVSKSDGRLLRFRLAPPVSVKRGEKERDREREREKETNIRIEVFIRVRDMVVGSATKQALICQLARLM